jgi:hypothetical protein
MPGGADMQLKLFRIYDHKETLMELNDLFNNRIVVLNKRIIGIPYDYQKNGYKQILEKTKELKVKQFIVTPRTFIKILNFCIEYNYFINEISFLESVPKEHQEFITKYRTKLNSAQTHEDKVSIANELFKELEWITVDESIDIKNIGFRIKAEEPPINVEISLYNNGVLLVDNEVVIEKVIRIFEGI